MKLRLDEIGIYDAPDWALCLMHVPNLRRLTLFTLKNLRVIAKTLNSTNLAKHKLNQTSVLAVRSFLSPSPMFLAQF
jgi:hypothetical protein